MAKYNAHALVKDFVIPVDTVVCIEDTVEQALESLRKNTHKKKIIYFYVVDLDKRLKGVVSTRSLLLNSPKESIGQIMEPTVVRVSAHQTLQDAMEVLSEYRLLALPVVDETDYLLGVVDLQIYMEEAFDSVQKRATADLFQMLGVQVEEEKHRGIWARYIRRMPWLFCNILGGIGCAIISRIFEMVLAKVLLLAMFIPLVLTLSESISMQSMSYSLQLLHKGPIAWKRLWLQLMREGKMVAFLGGSAGLFVGVLSLLWRETPLSALVIGIGIAISTLLSSLIGSALPLVLHARRLDPKVAAGPLVLMCADVLTTTLYLALATWWLLP